MVVVDMLRIELLQCLVEVVKQYAQWTKWHKENRAGVTELFWISKMTIEFGYLTVIFHNQIGDVIRISENPDIR